MRKHPPVPGQPHPDVAIVRALFEDLAPDEIVSYETLGKAIQLPADDPKLRQRARTAAKHLANEHIMSIACVPSVGYIRESASAIRDRIAGRESRSIRRKARSNVAQLGTIDLSQVPADERPGFYGLCIVNRIIQRAAEKRSQDKLVAASTVSLAELTTSKALDVLKERSDKSASPDSS